MTTVISTDFEELTGHKLGNLSLLKMFNILEDSDGETYMNIFRSYTVYESTLNDGLYFETYECNDDDWWDTVSYKMYETPELWWMICLTNGVVNPFEELEPGKNIKVLRDGYVPQLIREIRQISEF